MSESEPKWTSQPDGWYHCNECGSLDEHGKPRPFKCRTTNPATFNLCELVK